MDPKQYRLRQQDFGTQLLGPQGEGDDDSPLTHGIELPSDDDDVFFDVDAEQQPMDEGIDVEDLISSPSNSCQESIRVMKDIDLPSHSLPQLMWFAHAFCAVHQLKIHDTINIQIKSTEEAIFKNTQYNAQFLEWVRKANAEYMYYHNIWVTEREKRKTTWKDCPDPNNPIHVTFKSPKDDLWKFDEVFYQSIIIKYLSQSGYINESFVHHDLTYKIKTLDDFFNHAGNENTNIQDFGAWLLKDVYGIDNVDAMDPKPTLDWLIEEWKTLNACYFQVTTGPQIPQDFKDFIAKGIFFF
jgi:hypothetical protein